MLKSLLSFLFPQAVSLTVSTNSPLAPSQQANAITQQGAMIDNGALVSTLSAIASNAAPNSGSVNYQTSAAGTYLFSNVANAQLLLTNGGAVTVTMDNAPNIVTNIPGPFNGMTFPATIACIVGTSVAAPTVTTAGGSGGVTLAGALTTVAANSFRVYRGTITQLNTVTVSPLTAAAGSSVSGSGTTFVSLVQIGATNMYTLTLGSNTIVASAGNLIYVGTTAGTLPAAWYPVYTTVAHATVIVIATPPTSVAWTCTAASMVQPAAPTVPVFAPTITFTGMYQITGTVVA